MQHLPRRRFGQNFLIDRSVIDRIVAAIAPRAGDVVVEIGPGLGALTGPMLGLIDRLHVIEIDRDIVARLEREFPRDRLVVHSGDALEFDFAALGSKLRLVGNLPYNISTPLLFHVADQGSIVRDGHFMLQKEVVDRMVAEPGGGEYGRLSVALQYRFAMEKLFEVPPESAGFIAALGAKELVLTLVRPDYVPRPLPRTRVIPESILPGEVGHTPLDDQAPGSAAAQDVGR